MKICKSQNLYAILQILTLLYRIYEEVKLHKA